MMRQREIARTLGAMSVSEGAGVTVKRTIGLPTLKNLDPFLMLDHFSSDDPDDYIAGFPDHPHRGFVTLTYMLDGHMLHRDSMGNQGDLRAGGAQWMKAASGVIHSEMPQQSNGLMRGFQLWINLPSGQKMTDPAYQEFAAQAIPEVDAEGGDVRVLSGQYQGVRGPIHDPDVDTRYLDVTLPPHGVFVYPLEPELNAFVYVFDGEVLLGESRLSAHQLAVLGPGDEVAVTGGADGGRFILVAGRPLGEPIVQYGPFVMNTREEIDQALADYRDNRLVRKKAAMAGA